MNSQIYKWASFILLSLLVVPLAGAQTDHFGWTFECQREAIAPLYRMEKLGGSQGYKLVLSGKGSKFCNGHWAKNFKVVASTFVQIEVSATYQDLEEPFRSLISNLIWMDSMGHQVGPKEFPKITESRADGYLEMKQTYQVPDRAVVAKVTLVYRWDADGQVAYAPAILNQVPAMPKRLVKLSAIHHKPNQSSTAKNLKKFGELVREAGSKGADIVCLPESITLVGTKLDYISASESIPGPSTKYLGEIAKEQNMYIVAGLLERVEEIVYNTAVLIGRDGEIAGTYRKVSLPREEIEGGVSPGQAFPVFETDFGKIGMMICWDVSFPEPARALAMKGAEIIFMPIWGGNLTLGRARAIENQVYLVSSTYDNDMRTGVFDLEGKLLAEGSDENPVVVVEVDLEQQMLWPWLGEFKNRIKQEMPGKASEN